MKVQSQLAIWLSVAASVVCLPESSIKFSEVQLTEELPLLKTRQNTESNPTDLAYGFAAAQSWKVKAGKHATATWWDGFSISLTPPTDYALSAELVAPVQKEDLPDGSASLTPFSWYVNSTHPMVELSDATITVPINLEALRAIYPPNSTTAQATVVWRYDEGMLWRMPPANVALSKSFDSYVLSDIPSVDGEYVVIAKLP